MLIKIIKLKTLPDFKLYLEFEDGKTKIYDVKEDIEQTPIYEPLETIPGLFEQVQLHQSGGMIVWTPEIDLPCDILYAYGKDCEPMADQPDAGRRAAQYREFIVGELIRIRHEAGLSQAALAERSGVKQQVIARIEKGHSSPQVETVLRMLLAMDKKLVVTSV